MMILFHLVFLSSILCTASVAHVSPADSPTSKNLELESHLTASLFNSQIHQPDIYTKAVSILETLETSPSCHRVATLTLINSCQSLEKSASSEVHLHEVREEYATRLAICEIKGAKAPISPHCVDFIPSTRACSTGGLGGFFRRQKQEQATTQGKVCYPGITRSQVKQCISALNSRPQWWTSYSNALQNVVVVCHASRTTIEKDEILEQFKKAAVVGNDVTEAIAKALVQSNTFVSSIQSLQAQVSNDWEVEFQKSRSAMGQLIFDVQTAVHGMIESLRQGAEDASGHMDRLKQDIGKGYETARGTSSALQVLYTSARTHFDDMRATQREAWDHVGSRADEIGNTLATVNADLPDMLKVLQNILDHFQNSTQNLSALHAELEAKIDRNNNNLVIQEHLIKRLRVSGGLDIVQAFMLTFAVYIVLQFAYPVAAWLFMALAIGHLIYQALAALPFVHFKPIPTPSLPSHLELTHGSQAKIFVLISISIGLSLAVALVLRQLQTAMALKQRYQERKLKKTLYFFQVPNTSNLLPMLPQIESRSLLKAPRRVRFQDEPDLPRLGSLGRDSRGQTAPL